MKLHTFGEDYLKAIYILQKDKEYGTFHRCVRTYGRVKAQRQLRGQALARGWLYRYRDDR
ncbi:hypothetical protein [Streptococcus mutans]|nr:hypothetical protein SMU33_08428 [Streptococcus mutans 11SSST2]EMC15396.1 hypothetical protein SMU77_09427 [Streptococcus mutans NV1996]EMC30388.1 hypothetical protein SMU86_06263 [Streptococcus mutans U2A]QFG44674.1 putative mn-dependent transcriptional regulator [Streptococcus mutans]